jgi:hypothetical protein
MHEEMIDADGRAQAVDGRTIIPKRRGDDEAHSTAEICDHLRDLLGEGQIQRMKEPDIAVTRLALDGLARFLRYNVALLGDGITDARTRIRRVLQSTAHSIGVHTEFSSNGADFPVFGILFLPLSDRDRRITLVGRKPGSAVNRRTRARSSRRSGRAKGQRQGHRVGKSGTKGRFIRHVFFLRHQAASPIRTLPVSMGAGTARVWRF